MPGWLRTQLLKQKLAETHRDWWQDTAMIRKLMSMACLLAFTGATLAAQSHPIPMGKTDKALQKMVAQLRQAVKDRNAPLVYSVLAPDFYVARDFGGAYDLNATPVKNFSTVFEFDDTKLRPEYAGQGWHKLGKAMAGNQWEIKRDGQWCLPYGAKDRKPVPHEQLCWRKYVLGWKLQGYIHGGD
jgi:hypothetical protein